jgi:hypothetical protein
LEYNKRVAQAALWIVSVGHRVGQNLSAYARVLNFILPR